MRAIFIGPPSRVSHGNEPTYWVALAEYAGAVSDVPDGPGTRGFGEYELADARAVADDEAARLGLAVVDLTGTRQIA
ncbi:MAG: hypothetical protein JO032_21685 [Alphaproteobacteria bacterium]|nr:hypothetical protein [Alphaproteobacteria bacterium]MBV9555399.1 hypothetical protein [Alphaproteobacteria bacterium]